MKRVAGTWEQILNQLLDMLKTHFKRNAAGSELKSNVV